MQDLQAGKVLSVAQFRQRAAQILTYYGEVRGQENHSYLQKLVRGMPKRLAACKANAYGPGIPTVNDNASRGNDALEECSTQ